MLLSLVFSLLVYNHVNSTGHKDSPGPELGILFLCPLAGLLHAGDRLVEVNGHPVFGLEPEQIIKILVRSFNSFSLFLSYLKCSDFTGHDLRYNVFPHQTHSHGTVVFKVVPITDRPVNKKTMVSDFFCPGFLYNFSIKSMLLFFLNFCCSLYAATHVCLVCSFL